MNRSDFAFLLKSLLLKEGEVILPTIGALELQDAPATFSDGGNIISPPQRGIVFNSLRFTDDGVLARCIVDNEGITIYEARTRVNDFVSKIRRTLDDAGEFSLGGLGVLRASAGGIEFIPDDDLLISKDSYGLQDITDATLTSSEGEAPVESVDEEKEVAKERVEEREDTGVEQDQEEERGKERVQNEETTKKQSHRAPRVILWIIVILLIIVLALLLIYLFRESLKPLLEKILYTPEELRILNYKL